MILPFFSCKGLQSETRAEKGSNMTSSNKFFIPESVKTLKQWCAWKIEQSNGRTTKIPYQVNGKRASSTNRNTWNNFDAVSELLARDRQYDGYGFMVSDSIVFVDVDHCIDNGNMDKRGADILSAFPMSYAEISQSGTGLHILTRGTLSRNFHNQKQGVEMYSSARFCAMTGNAIQAYEPAEEQDGISYVFNKYGRHSRISNGYTSAGAISCHNDRWIIDHASAITGERGRDFRSLFFDGDTRAYASASEADSALCTLLAFWCDRDPVQIDRLFRQSALYRPKWERHDYRNGTINHACEHIPESLSEYIQRHQREVNESASVMQFLNCGE